MAIKHYVSMFQRALIEDGKLCLCAVLGAEIGSLPTSVGGNTRIFFSKNIEWLTTALTAAGFSDTKAKANALHIISSLEGAMIISKSLGENAVFESVAKTLVRFVDR